MTPAGHGDPALLSAVPPAAVDVVESDPPDPGRPRPGEVLLGLLLLVAVVALVLLVYAVNNPVVPTAGA